MPSMLILFTGVLLLCTVLLAGCSSPAGEHAEASVTIAAPAGVVWTWIAEPAKYIEWHPGYSGYEIIGEEEGHPGARFLLSGEADGAPVTLDCTVTAWSEPLRYGYRGRSDTLDFVGTYTIVSTAEGCTVTAVEDRVYHGLNHLADGTEAQENVDAHLASLKFEAEMEVIDLKYGESCICNDTDDVCPVEQ